MEILFILMCVTVVTAAVGGMSRRVQESEFGTLLWCCLAVVPAVASVVAFALVLVASPGSVGWF